MVGLYKAPTPPARGSTKPDAAAPREDSAPRPAKSNVRNARSSDGPSTEKSERSSERPPKRERSEKSDRGSRQGDRPRGGDGSTVESTRVYVGNLSYEVTEQDLQELFKGIGGVRNVEIVYNRSTHRSKGYGFVEMLRKDEAVRSVEVLHDQPFMGRKLVVSGAKSKGQDEREDKEERPEREPRPVVVAPLPAAVAAVASAAVAATSSAEDAPTSQPAAEAAEPVIQTIIETVTPAEIAAEAAAETAPEPIAEAAPTADDLVSKYGFDAPAEKPE
jgi:RNA recognition motif-containing protein